MEREDRIKTINPVVGLSGRLVDFPVGLWSAARCWNGAESAILPSGITVPVRTNTIIRLATKRRERGPLDRKCASFCSSVAVIICLQSQEVQCSAGEASTPLWVFMNPNWSRDAGACCKHKEQAE